MGYAVMKPGSWVMEREMLLTIKEHAETHAHEPASAEPGSGQARRAARRPRAHDRRIRCRAL